MGLFCLVFLVTFENFLFSHDFGFAVCF